MSLPVDVRAGKNLSSVIFVVVRLMMGGEVSIRLVIMVFF